MSGSADRTVLPKEQISDRKSPIHGVEQVPHLSIRPDKGTLDVRQAADYLLNLQPAPEPDPQPGRVSEPGPAPAARQAGATLVFLNADKSLQEIVAYMLLFSCSVHTYSAY